MNKTLKWIHQWSWLVLVAFCTMGLIYPPIGAVALVCMLAPVVMALFKGRMWCGNFCPRGSFNDVVLSKISRRRPIPQILKRAGFKFGFLVVLMSMFALQLVLSWGDAAAVGFVFIRMIIATTLIGILLGILYSHRTWCTICPMGTMASYISRLEGIRKRVSHVTFQKNKCVNCKLCSKTCPIGIEVLKHKESGRVEHADCLKCRVCVEKCPKKALEIA